MVQMGAIKTIAEEGANAPVKPQTVNNDGNVSFFVSCVSLRIVTVSSVHIDLMFVSHTLLVSHDLFTKSVLITLCILLVIFHLC